MLINYCIIMYKIFQNSRLRMCCCSLTILTVAFKAGIAIFLTFSEFASTECISERLVLLVKVLRLQELNLGPPNYEPSSPWPFIGTADCI